MTISQKEGVYNCVVSILNEADKAFEDGAKVKLTTDERKTCITMLIAATEAGELTVKSEKARTDLPKYWDGTLSNWLRKDLRLNGDVPHHIKNPGSRAGSSDPELKELKKLMAKVKGTEHEDAVQEEIDKRLAVIASEKVKDVEIDMSILNPDLVAKLQSMED